jgi:hypothetical protein
MLTREQRLEVVREMWALSYRCGGLVGHDVLWVYERAALEGKL